MGFQGRCGAQKGRRVAARRKTVWSETVGTAHDTDAGRGGIAVLGSSRF